MQPRETLRARIALGLSLALCAAAVFWIANGVAPWDSERSNVWHHYEYMAQGFLDGHTHLSVDPPPELLRLKDPYDPAANAPYRLWDASLYHGRYYFYYGPGPAVALMVPWKLVSGHMLSQRMAVAVFAALGLAGLALLLWDVRQRCFPRLSGPVLGGILITVFHAAWLPVILRRPGVWELPIVSAAACLWWTLYFLWRYFDSGGRVRWAACAGLATALMICCRVTNVFEATVVVLLFAAASGKKGTSKNWKAFIAAAAIVGAAGIALLCFNFVRFGRWLEFGQSYMLGGQDIRGAHLVNPSFIPFHIWTYLLSLPDFGPYFPFLHATWPASFPQGYLGYEAMYGALFTMPVHLAGIAGVAWAWRKRADPALRATAIAVAAAVCSTGFAAAILFNWQGATSRYIAELFAGWTVATAVGMMGVFGSEDAPRVGRAARALTAFAACWTIACVWLASAEFRGFMRQTNPRTYSLIAHALDYPSQWWIESRGIRFSPVHLDIRVPAAGGPGETVLMASGFPEKDNQLILARVDARRVRLILNGNEDSVLETPPLHLLSGSLRVLVSAPWLYPPAEHPYWDRLDDPSRRHELQTLFSVASDSGTFTTHSTHSFDASAFEPVVRSASGTDGGSPWVESIGLVGPNP